ncbi:MAG: SMI1/KNR4 family protein [Hymenobacter sp.]|nr:MAG: SMI1/KNR4 family protein [Hymenobacter sp.]
MSELINQLEGILSEEFTDEDGEAYQAKLLPALSIREIAALEAQMPSATIPQEVNKLLSYSRGINFGWFQPVSFDAFGEFGLLGLFPACIELRSDGAGNFWLLDINKGGEWGAVFYVCHDPPVVVRQANNLWDFLRQLHEHAKREPDAWLDEVYDHLVFKIWEERKMHSGLVAAAVAATSADAVLSQFAARQPPEFLLGDLRVGSITVGFAYEKFFRDRSQQVYKHETEPMWAFEPPKYGWFSRLFG